MTPPRSAPTPELERSLESYFYQRVKSAGGICLKIAPTQAGAPDRLVILPGGHIHLVELKTDQGPLRPIQSHWHDKAAKLGVHVHVLRGRVKILDWLRATLDSAYLGHRYNGPGTHPDDDPDDDADDAA